jgi:uncharacterized membrane protein
MDILVRFILYGILGWCGEILWTAITRLLRREPHSQILIGETSLWSFPLYGSAVFLFEPLHNILRGQFFLVRAVIYLFGFWMIEYLGGWLVWKITKTKPWDYSQSPGGSLNGLIRWNFVLIWPLVGLLGEIIHDFAIRLTPLIISIIR